MMYLVSYSKLNTLHTMYKNYIFIPTSFYIFSISTKQKLLFKVNSNKIQNIKSKRNCQNKNPNLSQNKSTVKLPKVPWKSTSSCQAVMDHCKIVQTIALRDFATSGKQRVLLVTNMWSWFWSDNTVLAWWH